MEKSLKDRLKESLKARGLRIPALSKITGIPKDRIYGWYRDNTNPKAEDAIILSRWINGETSIKNEENGNRGTSKDQENISKKQESAGSYEHINETPQETISRLARSLENQAEANRIQAEANKKDADTRNELVAMLKAKAPIADAVEVTVQEMTNLVIALRSYTTEIGAMMKKTAPASELAELDKRVMQVKKSFESKGKIVSAGK